MGEALLTDYALVTWVVMAVFCFAQLLRMKNGKRGYAGIAVALVLTAVSVYTQGATMNAAVLAVVLLMLA